MYFILLLLELLPLHNAPLVGPSPHCLPLKAICTKSYMNVYSCAFIQDFSFCWAHLGHHHSFCWAPLGHHHFVALKRIICGLLHNFPHIPHLLLSQSSFFNCNLCLKVPMYSFFTFSPQVRVWYPMLI